MEHRLTEEQASTYFQMLGIDATITSDPAEASSDADIDSLIDHVRAKANERQNAEIESRKKAAIGKQMGALRSLVAREFGFSRAALEGLSMNEIIEKVRETAVAARQAKIDKANELLAGMDAAKVELEQRISAAYQAKIDELSAGFNRNRMLDAFAGMVAGQPRRGGNIQQQAEMILDDAQSRYIVRLGDDGKPEFYQKSNPDLKVMDGKNPLSPERFTRETLDALGLIVHDTRHIVPRETPSRTVPNQSEPVPNQSEINPAIERYRDRLQDHINNNY